MIFLSLNTNDINIALSFGRVFIDDPNLFCSYTVFHLKNIMPKAITGNCTFVILYIFSFPIFIFVVDW